MTIDYKKLLKIYQNYSEFDEIGLGIPAIQAEYEKEIIAKYKELFGKKKKFDKAVRELPDDIQAAIKKPYEDIISARYHKRLEIRNHMESMLRDYAKVYIPQLAGEMNKVKSSDSSDYHTQGYGAYKYAKESLTEHKLLLELYGYETEIREYTETYSSSDVNHTKFELWANITEFDYWMFSHGGNFISVLNWAVLCWRKSTNPKVYFPFLSDDDYEKSLALYRDMDYNIGKGNCELEPCWDEIKNKTYRKG